MNIKNRLVIIIFFLINSPIFAIAAFVITSLIEPEKSFLPNEVKKNVNWFAQNADTSRTIVTVLYVLAGIFAVIAIYNILGAAWDNSSDRDA